MNKYGETLLKDYKYFKRDTFFSCYFLKTKFMIKRMNRNFGKFHLGPSILQNTWFRISFHFPPNSGYLFLDATGVLGYPYSLSQSRSSFRKKKILYTQSLKGSG